MEIRKMTRVMTLAAAIAIAVSPAALRAQESGELDGYHGLFASLGVGMGAIDCFNDLGCYKVFAANFRIGTRISRHVGLALGAEGFAADEVSAGLLSAQVLFYPTGKDMFAVVGAGIANANEGSPGAGLTFGIGYDISLNRRRTVALTPYVGLVLTTVADPDWNFIYAGLGITWK